jgi:hypothetical protein
MSAHTPPKQPGIKGKVKRFFSRSKQPVAEPAQVPASHGARYAKMVHPDLNPLDENAPLLDRLKSSASAGFSTFKVVLKIAAESSEWNPIVKSVLGGVTAMLEHFGVR